jgi:hypothetical protein
LCCHCSYFAQRYEEAAARTGQKDPAERRWEEKKNPTENGWEWWENPAENRWARWREIRLQEIFDEDDSFGIVSEREDVFWELHTIVAGVKSASDTSRCYIDRKEVPPPKQPWRCGGGLGEREGCHGMTAYGTLFLIGHIR